MNQQNDISKRAVAIKKLIASNNLRQAGKKLMDFARDFSVSKSYINPSISINQSYSNLQKNIAYGILTNEQININSSEIGRRMLILIDEIQEQPLNAKISEKPDLKSADRKEVVKKYFKEKTVVNGLAFKGIKITKTFQKTKFELSNIDLSLRLGEITGIIGENGNGKTTLCKIVAGNLKQSSGEIFYPILNEEKDSIHNWIELKKQIAFLPETPPPFKGTVKENLHFEAALHGIFNTENEEVVDFIINRLNLAKYEKAKWTELSSGFRLRFALAKILVWKPKLIVLDEPLANLDIKAQIEVLSDIKDLARSFRYPLAVLITSQHIIQIERISDRIMHLKNGKIEFYGDVKSIGANRMENTFEFECKMNVEELSLKLKMNNIQYSNLKYNGLNFILATGIEINSDNLFAFFVDEKIKVNYFRNISQSRKKQMLETNE